MRKLFGIVLLVFWSNVLIGEELVPPAFRFALPQEVIEEYVRAEVPERWSFPRVDMRGNLWVQTRAHTDATHFVDGLRAFLKNDAHKIGPLAQRIATTFPNLYPATVIPSGHVVSARVDQEKKNRGGTAVCFVAANLYHSNPRQYSTRWDPVSKSIIIKSAMCTTAWLRAIVLHELGHGVRDLEGAPSAKTKDPYLYSQEEVEMHDLETRILDFHTKGSFSRAIDKVARELYTLAGLQAITIEQMHEIDKATDIHMRYGVEARSIIAAHYSFALASRLVQLHGGDDSDRIEWYIWTRNRSHEPLPK